MSEMKVWPTIHTLLVQFAPRIAEAEAASSYDERIAIINGVSAHIAGKLEERIAARLRAMEEALAEARDDAAELQRIFDMQWEAAQRGVDRWRAANPGNELVRPDRADMVVWLIEELDRLTGALRRIADRPTAVGVNPQGLVDFARALLSGEGQ